METIERFRNFINDVNTYYEGNMIDLFPYVDMLNNVLKILNDLEELEQNYLIIKYDNEVLSNSFKTLQKENQELKERLKKYE